ncbi:MAG: protein-disulfide reductase DsbD N-terminal domain-containing protein [Bacteroidales bacterium]|nr:protein-disulfide reductase DsbD N-terminal domain-containing protein [Bacteroidales bacterium]
MNDLTTLSDAIRAGSEAAFEAFFRAEFRNVAFFVNIALTIETETPQFSGFTVGEPLMPPARPFGAAGTTVYEDAVTIRIPVEAQTSGPVSCTVGWQSCDDKICAPPQTKTFKFMVRL